MEDIARSHSAHSPLYITNPVAGLTVVNHSATLLDIPTAPVLRLLLHHPSHRLQCTNKNLNNDSGRGVFLMVKKAIGVAAKSSSFIDYTGTIMKLSKIVTLT